jgi:hypothetical protein
MGRRIGIGVAIGAMMVLLFVSTRAQSAVIDRDQAQCGYDEHRNVATLSADDAGPLLPPIYLMSAASVTAQTTTVRDPLPLDFSPSKNFVGHGGGVRIVYDPRHRIIALCGVGTKFEDLSVVSDTSPPRFAVAQADLSRVATAHGLHLGSTAADVRRVYGQAPLVSFGHGHRGLAYQRFVSSAGRTAAPLGIYTSFELRNDRVVQITRSTGF